MSYIHHPRALTWLTATYALFMIGFGSLIASLVLYQTNALHMIPNQAYEIYSAFAALIWILPLGGGYLSTRLGYINAARIGLLCAAVALLILSVQRPDAFWIGLALFIIGNAFATPAIWCLVDHCYSKTSPLRESGFTLFYLFFNLTGMIGIFLGGYIAQALSFSFSFRVNAFCLFLSFLLLHIVKHTITAHKGRSILPQVSWSKRAIWATLVGIILIATPITIALLKHVTLNNILAALLLIGTTALLIRIASRQQSKPAKYKILAFIGLSLISIIFWTLYSLEPSLLSIYINTHVDTSIFGLSIPASSFFAFDSVFVVLFGLILSRLWILLNTRNKNPTLPTKFAASLLIIGLGFCLLGFISRQMGNTLMPSSIIICAYAFFALGELLISPLGISMVGRLAPEGHEGLMMGFWQLCIGGGGALSGYIATAPYFPPHATLASENLIYSNIFWIVGGSSIVATLIVCIGIKRLKRLILEPLNSKNSDSCPP